MKERLFFSVSQCSLFSERLTKVEECFRFQPCWHGGNENQMLAPCAGTALSFVNTHTHTHTRTHAHIHKHTDKRMSTGEGGEGGKENVRQDKRTDERVGG